MGRKSKENRKEIQALVFRGSSLFKGLRRPPQQFFFLKPIPAFWRRMRAGIASSPKGRSSVLFVFVSCSSCLFKQEKGWRHFDRGRRLCQTLDAISVRLGAREPHCAKKGTLQGPKARGPGKDRPIDPMSGMEFARLNARSGVEPLGMADGRQPFMP
jgi:hypothetical protein